MTWNNYTVTLDTERTIIVRAISVRDALWRAQKLGNPVSAEKS